MKTIEKTIQSSWQRSRHNAMAALSAELESLTAGRFECASQLLVSTIGCVSMAHTGVVPEQLRSTPYWNLIVDYATATGLALPQIDKSVFGGAAVNIFSRSSLASHKDIGSDFDALYKNQGANILRLLIAFHNSAGLTDGNSAGWMRQCFTRKTSSISDQHKGRAEFSELAALTQWFTPDWIADFLIDQSINNKRDSLFLDPAMGAGHLLSGALAKLFSLSGGKREADLNAIIESQLFGLEIDAELLDVATFTLYLAARKIHLSWSLPAPNLFYMASSNQAAQSFGALWLGCNKPESTLRLQRATGQVLEMGWLPERFDAVAMNPPYLSHRLIPEELSKLLRTHYAESKYDLYAAFVDMAVRKLAPGGRLATICQQSFLTVQRYYDLRRKILDRSKFSSVVHLGSGSFATKYGEKVNNAIVVLEAKEKSEHDEISCWRLLSPDQKLTAERSGIKASKSQVLSNDQVEFLLRRIPKGPLCFWAPTEILHLFAKHPSLESAETGIICTNGLFTCNNEKFIKRFSQLNESERKDYVSYDKGGGHKWFRTSPLMLRWGESGEEIRKYRKQRGQSTSLPGESQYFKAGITYSYIGTRGFKARLLSPNSVFDIASSAIFTEQANIYFVLGLLNSSLIKFVLGVLNPTINFQIGDLRRIPFAVSYDQELALKIAELSSRAVDIAKEAETYDPDSPRWRADAREGSASDKPEKDCSSHLLGQWNEEEKKIQAQINEIVFDLYGISSETRALVEADPWVVERTPAFQKHH